MNLSYIDMASPVGHLKLVAHDSALLAVTWENEKPKGLQDAELVESKDHPILWAAEQQLAEYFAGQRQQFDLPLAFVGTAFLQQVWQALQRIPFAETRSYRDIAAQIGNVKAVRAVGAANGKNPIAIIIPCHRVIGINGQLVGFTGGLNNKQLLLRLEQQVVKKTNN